MDLGAGMRFCLIIQKIPKYLRVMAETLKLRVKCHACNNVIEGTAKYGSGHYVPEGVDFEFVATGKVEGASGKRVRAEVTCTCPNCGVRCKFNLQ
jgi:hypothetical protein